MFGHFRYADPFEDYKQRLAKKLQAKAHAAGTSHEEAMAAVHAGSTLTSDISLTPLPPGQDMKKAKDKERDDVNWFGVKLGDKEKDKASGAASVGGVAVGKYLNIPPSTAVSGGSKRPPQDVADNGKKKRKLGFGNFDVW
jgi:peptidyl-prolyl cis-trans isomerase-like protein 2